MTIARLIGFVTLVVAAVVGVAPARADAPRFDVPIACAIGTDCYIQNYVDEDPGPDRRDFACGRLSYDGHKGTDFRLPDLVAMERGVPVLAAAPGVVRAIRDGMDDVNIRTIGRKALGGRDAGNSVVVVHGDGWETQYAHMRKGSVAVRPGDRVEAGQRLGLVGLSGNTEFPHVHFEVRKDGRTVDPFVGPVPFAACDAERHPMWTVAAGERLAYRPTAGLTAGFAGERPTAEAARAGTYGSAALSADTPVLVLWADVMGVLAGDRQSFRITGPDGRVLLDQPLAVADSRVAWFAFAGLRRPPEGWTPGLYTGQYRIERDGAAVVDMIRTLTLR